MSVYDGLCLIGVVFFLVIVCVFCIAGEYQANMEKHKSDYLNESHIDN
jgi:hypothetical protein